MYVCMCICVSVCAVAYAYAHICVCMCTLYSHRGHAGHGLQAGGVADELVQRVDVVIEARPGVAVLLPAVQHELVQGSRAVHGRGQAVVLLNSVDHLRTP